MCRACDLVGQSCRHAWTNIGLGDDDIFWHSLKPPFHAQHLLSASAIKPYISRVFSLDSGINIRNATFRDENNYSWIGNRFGVLSHGTGSGFFGPNSQSRNLNAPETWAGSLSRQFPSNVADGALRKSVSAWPCNGRTAAASKPRWSHFGRDFSGFEWVGNDTPQEPPRLDWRCTPHRSGESSSWNKTRTAPTTLAKLSEDLYISFAMFSTNHFPTRASLSVCQFASLPTNGNGRILRSKNKNSIRVGKEVNWILNEILATTFRLKL